MYGSYKSSTLYYSNYIVLFILHELVFFAASNTILTSHHAVILAIYHHTNATLKGVHGEFYIAKTNSTPMIGFKNV